MDLFTVNLDGSRGTQIHDFSFGIPPSGLFWTAAVAEDSVEGELDDGFVSFRATNLSLPDAESVDAFAHASEVATCKVEPYVVAAGARGWPGFLPACAVQDALRIAALREGADPGGILKAK